MDVQGEVEQTQGDGEARRAALAGKYLTFELGGDAYGLEILKVREIIGLLEITRVPRAPAVVRGVINLRGRVIPVLDMRARFGLPAEAATEQTVIIVVQCVTGGRPLTMGILVDRVLEVHAIDAAGIEPPPDLGGAAVEGAFILGVGKAGGRIVFLLDLDRILDDGAAGSVADLAEAGGTINS